MLDAIFALDKKLALANHRLRSHFPDYAIIHQFIEDYLVSYADHNHLTSQSIVDCYNNFAKIYSKHLDIFEENNKYPVEYSDNTVIDRISYDLALILSCVTNDARFQIIHHLFDYIKNHTAQDRICVIGAGSGIELALIRKFNLNCSLTAYDLSFNDFIRNSFHQAELREANFIESDVSQTFDIIFAIEFLEHITDYRNFLEKTYRSLTSGGHFVCTTATNMPQFDHLYNFRDIESFKDELNKIGFTVVAHQKFHHKQSFQRTDSSNDWFVLKK